MMKVLVPILISVFWITPLWANEGELQPCGQDGNLDVRMNDCEVLNGNTGKMKLVMIDESGNVLKMDVFGLLWGPSLDGTFAFFEAAATCANVTEAEGYPKISGINQWRVPRGDEFAVTGRAYQYPYNERRELSGLHEDLEGDGSWTELTSAYLWYWTSSEGPIPGHEWGFEGYGGEVNIKPHDIASVRCVAKAK